MRTPLTAALTAALAAVTAPSQEPVSAREFADAAAWFDGLGHPRVASTPFVRVATGAWVSSGNEAPRNTYVRGFLLDDEGPRFTVWTLGLERRSFDRTPAGTAAHERVGYDVESLRDFARRVVAADAPGGAEQPVPLEAVDRMAWPGGATPGRGAALFVLARVLDQEGEQDLALALAREAYRASHRAAGPATLRGLLARDLSHAAFWRLVLAFDQPDRPFAQLLAECERFLQRFPDSRHAARARETRAILARMVAEQRARPPLPADADEDARIAELVFDLREQNGKQWSQPGSCDVFADPRGEESPAHRLVAHGYRALPHLLPALDDDGFTRCVGFHRNFHFSHHVLRVRDVAAAVFGRITGTWVEDRADAERLLRDLERRGERAFLVEGAARGNPVHAERLVRGYPDEALPALRKALDGATSDHARVELVAVVSGLPGDAVDALLRAELRREGAVRSQVAAAVALTVRGRRDEAIDAMVALWQRDPAPAPRRPVGEFLAVCGAARAVEALASRPGLLDDDVLRALGSGHTWLRHVLAPGGEGRVGLEAVHDADVDAAVERLLGELLDSRRRFRGTFNSTRDPELRDFAADALATRWPERYAFDFGAARAERERQIGVLLDV